MKLKPPRTGRPVYYFRNDAEAPERGPFALEGLRDLAEFGHITPAVLIRKESDPEAAPLSENPELLREVFPERTRLHLGHHETGTTTESRFRPVGLTAARQCSPDDEAAADEAPVSGAQAAETGSGGETAGRSGSSGLHLNPERKNYKAVCEDEAEKDASAFDPKRTLQEISEKSRREFVEPEDKESQWKPWLTVFARFSGTLVFAGFGISIWVGMNPAQMHPLLVVVEFIMGLALVTLGFFFILPEAMRVITAPLNAFVNSLMFGSAQVSRKADYGAAELYLQNGNKEHALREYKKIVSRFPKEIPAYIQAIRLCRELDREREAENLYNTALRRISSTQDRNLFIGSVRRMKTE